MLQGISHRDAPSLPRIQGVRHSRRPYRSPRSSKHRRCNSFPLNPRGDPVIHTPGCERSRGSVSDPLNVSNSFGEGSKQKPRTPHGVQKVASIVKEEDYVTQFFEWHKSLERIVAAVALSAVLLAGSASGALTAAAVSTSGFGKSSSSTSTTGAAGVPSVTVEVGGLGVDWGGLGLRSESKDDFSEEQARQLVEEVYSVVAENFLDVRNNSFDKEQWEKLREQALGRSLKGRGSAYNAVRDMLKELNDPFTRFLTPQQFAPLSKYDVTGVGLNLGDGEKGKVVVLGIVLDSEAFQAGLRQGDVIAKVDGKLLVKSEGMSAFDVSAMISGPLDTSVHVQAYRPSDNAMLDVDLVRRVEPPKTPVTYRLEGETGGGLFGGPVEGMGDSVGYIALSEFNSRAKADVSAAVHDLVENQGATSLVLDLRDNRGGLVTAGVEVAKLFLQEGSLVVSTEGRGGARTRQEFASKQPITDRPLMVLVNGSTASAAEIVSGALRDNCRAALVGERTFGKGLIQSVYELSDGSALVITVGRYITPAGTDIDREGIVPDLVSGRIFQSRPSAASAAKALAKCSTPVVHVADVAKKVEIS